MSKLDDMIGVTELKKQLYEVWNSSIGIDTLLERIKDMDQNDSRKDVLIERIYNKHQRSMDILHELLYEEDEE